MNSLQRMMAAIRGEPKDRYPFINPYPTFSLMPWFGELCGLTWAHQYYGSDEQRLACLRAMRDVVGLDWLPMPWGPAGQDRTWRIEVADGGTPPGPPTLDIVNVKTGEREHCTDFPPDLQAENPHPPTVREIEALPAPTTAEAMLAGDGCGFARRAAKEFGDNVFLFGGDQGPFAACYRVLGFVGVYEAVATNPALIHAISERHVEQITQNARLHAALGAHGLRINEYPAGGELLSDSQYRELIFPYERRALRAIRDAGLVAILEYLGFVEPRLPHFAQLDLNCLQTESSLKNYRNDIGEIRRALGEEVCLFTNSRIRETIELGDEAAWRADAAEQARGAGRQRRMAVCAGSPTTWNTGPDRLRRYGQVMAEELAKLAPPTPAN